MGRLLALSIVAASVFLQCLPTLPAQSLLFQITGAIGALLLVILWRQSFQNRNVSDFWWTFKRITINALIILLFGTSSLAWFVWRAEMRLMDRLSVEHENEVTKIAFLITGLVQDQGESLRFEAEVVKDEKLDSRYSGIPRHIQIVWRKSMDEPASQWVTPGQTWRAALILRRPHSALNPHGFDYEAHLLSRNIRAIGRVRGTPVLLSENPFASMPVMVSRVRQYLRGAMRTHIVDMTFGAVLIALAIGDQDSVRAEHWEIFNKTGITHLVSISGSHVTMLAAFGGLSMLWLWKRLRWQGIALAERLPAKVMAAIAALCVAWVYCLLAGWGVPARRTFFMLLVSGMALLTRLPIRPSSVLCFAAAIVTIIDPWSPISTGFWLSFGAVAVLFYLGSQSNSLDNESMSLRQRCWTVCKESARLQWMITLSMLPALAFLFQQVSISSPLANAIAIPVVTFIVTPLALLMGVIALIPRFEVLADWVARIAHLALDGCMVPVTWLAYVSWSELSVAAPPVWSLLLSLAGIAWALQPPGVLLRWAGWFLLLPALTWQQQRLDHGSWRVIAMDVGQGGGILVQTKHHVLVFDAGPRIGMSDAGQRVVSPLLRAQGIKHIDVLVVSHSDIDHAGGLFGLLQKIPVNTAYASFNLESWLNQSKKAVSSLSTTPRPKNMLPCLAGQSWMWDGVIFSMLHPSNDISSTNHMPMTDKNKGKRIRSNAQSCVLHVKGKYHSALLPGDIGIKQEAEILSRARTDDLRADVVIVGHHGSETSSSQHFISQMRAKHAIAQVGHFNRFSHPSPKVQERWRSSLTKFWRTDQHGAITSESNADGLFLVAEAERRKKYWHERGGKDQKVQ